MLSLIRKIASVLLLLCFVLPLSTCSFKPDKATSSSSKEAAASSAEENAQQTKKDESLYAYEIVKTAFDDLRKDELTGGSLTMLAVFVVFFLPCCLLGLKEKPQAIITILAAIGAGFTLFFWVFFGRTPQIGGMLAIMCWSSLLLVSLIYSVRWGVQWCRQRKLRNQ